ncbi:MAG: hypothetical protein GY778_03190 [bacterium]|nr:hypothetical protein [bacterium]
MAKRDSTQKSSDTPPFEEHVKAVLQRLRAALSEVVAVVGADPTRPQSVAREFGLNKNLTWKISKIIGEEEPHAAIPHIPGRSGMRIFMDSLEQAGAPRDAIASVRGAMSEFERVIDVHAGDRETLEMMLGGLSKDPSGQQRAEAQRKMAFRGNSATWGVQARVQICANFIAPGDDQEWADLAWLSGLTDFRRLRRDAVWAIASARRATDDGTVLPAGMIQPIDPDFADEDSAPLLGAFCSDPTPEINCYTGPDGIIRYELAEGPVGNTAAATCIIGIVGRRFVRRYSAENDTIGEHLARLYTPVELLIHDLFVHKDLSYAFSPELFLYSQLPSGPAFPTAGRDRGLLPVAERVIDLGGGPPDVVTPELPRYPHMIRSVFDRLKWDATDFRGFRVKMRYPPIPTLAILRYDLPERS